MKVTKSSLIEFIGGEDKTLIIPVYQRGYAWGKSQAEKLFRDIEQVAKMRAQGEANWEHFTGTVVYVPHHSEFRYAQCLLIDGQQRITTITLLILVICKSVRDDKQRRELLDKYIMNSEAAADISRIRLRPVRTILRILKL